MAEADCYCVVYSVADKQTFYSSRETLATLVSIAGHRTACVLVANKTDLVRQRQVHQHGALVVIDILITLLRVRHRVGIVLVSVISLSVHPVDSLGWVTPGAATEGVTRLFFS